MDFPGLSRSRTLVRETTTAAPLHYSLNFKLLAIVVGVLAMGVVTSSVLLLTLQRQQLIDGAREDSSRVGRAIEASLQHAMLTNDREMATAIVRSATGGGGIERIRILDARGLVKISSDAPDVGRQFDRAAPLCRGCHSTATTSGFEQLPSELNAGHEVLVTVSPVRNQLQCAPCHDPQAQVLGLLMTETSLDELDGALRASEGRILLSAGVTLFLMAGLIWLALRRLVIRPVTDLARGMTLVGGGNLDAPVHVAGNDEIGDLARVFDTMRQRLKKSVAETMQSNQELAVLNEVAGATGRLVDLDAILRLVLEIVVDKLQMQSGLIYLWSERRKRFERVQSRGLADEQLAEIDRRRETAGGDLTGEVAGIGNVRLVPDMSTSRHFDGLFENLAQRAYINVPLKSQGKIVGTMELSTLPGHRLTERKIEVVKAVGSEIGIAIDNAALLGETRRREQEATTLSDLGTQISASLDVDQVLGVVAEGARQIMAADIGVVGLRDKDPQSVTLRAFSGTRALALDPVTLSLESELGRNLIGNRAVMVEDLNAALPAGDPVAALSQAEGIVSVLAVPLWHGGGLRGLVGVMTRGRQRFSTADVRLLTRLAQPAAVAIDNAQLYHQVRYVAVLEERDRLAREMHDNLAQALGYLNMKAAITSDLLSKGGTEQAQASLLELRQVVQTTYSDVREAIFSLRTTVSSGWGLVPTMTEYLAEYRAHYGIDAQLVVDDHYAAELPMEVEIQITRIAQEALTNVRKHSGAHQAFVRFQEEERGIRMTVEDDGQGFDTTHVASVDREHFGLEIMRERAQAVGGTLELDSRLGYGTRIILRVPVKAGAKG